MIVLENAELDFSHFYGLDGLGGLGSSNFL